MSRAFTWWRRFHGDVKLPKKYMYKGASQLQQRIEFGEYEFNHLGREVYLEDLIYETKVADLRAEKSYLKTKEALEDQIIDMRKQYHKRRTLIMKAHLEAEAKLLRKLAEDLDAEFELGRERISDIMEEFNGTTRELYFHCKSLAVGKTLDPDKMQRFCNEQPRHILKPKERKYAKLWMKLVKEKGWQEFLNWEQLNN